MGVPRRAGAPRLGQIFVWDPSSLWAVTGGVVSGGFGRLGALAAGGDRQRDHLASAGRPPCDLELRDLSARPLPLEPPVVAIERPAPLHGLLATLESTGSSVVSKNPEHAAT
jgi:hypothetical protein